MNSFMNIVAYITDDSLEVLISAAVIALVVTAIIVLIVLRNELRLPFFIISFLLAMMVTFIIGFAFLGPYGLILIVIFWSLVIRYSLTSRASLATHVFSAIGASMRQNLPLPTALAAEAIGLRGKPQRIMCKLSDYLAQGLLLSKAIKLGYPQCPGFALAMVASAERIDQLPQAIANIEFMLADRSRESRKLKPVDPAYPIAIILFTITVALGLMYFVIPMYQAILTDIGGKLPVVTQVFINLFGTYYTYYEWIICALLALALAVPWFIFLAFRPRRPGKPYLSSRLGDAIRWHVPVLRWFSQRYALIQITSFLRLALASGCTLDQAIAGASELDVNLCYRRKLRRWLTAVQSGRPAAEAARRCGVGKGLAWALDQDINPGNAPATLEMLESVYKSSYGYLANLARLIFWPCTTIAVASFVGLVVYSMFSPLVAIIDATMRTVLP